MFDTFKTSFALRNTYKANSIIWALKGIPIVKKFLPSSLYANRGIKIFANILSILWEIADVFLGKIIYLLIVFSLAKSMGNNTGANYAHILTFMTIIGGIVNTHIFNPTKDKFYAISLMRMNARKYTLTDYTYFLIKMFVGLTVCSILFGRNTGASIVTCLVVGVYVICVKLCFTALNLKECKKTNSSHNENKLSKLKWIAIAILLAVSVTPYINFVLPEFTLWIISAAIIIPTVFAIKYIVGFDSYEPIYKQLLQVENFAPSTGFNSAGAVAQLSLQKKINSDMTQTSDKFGYKYFNELFMKRHSSILTRSAKRITICLSIFFVGSAIALEIFPKANKEVNEMLITYLPYFLFVMYIINRGRTITQAMFMNCDHSMLTYRFYRQPKALLSLFVERLKYVVTINLMPAAVIAVGLPVLLYVSGGSSNPLNYVLLFVSILAMSIFFSVHNMVIYYLLQPYNVNLESKSAAFSIVNGLTYMISYAAIQFKLPTIIFGSVITAFCIIYVIVAIILAYRLAPKTFRLRN